MPSLPSIVVIVTALAALPSVAAAGDPCPIGFDVVDLGVPAWAKPDLRAKVKGGDPFFKALVRVAAKQDCSEVTPSQATGDDLPVPFYDIKLGDKRLELGSIRKHLFTKTRGFRCAQAARSLRHLKNPANTSGLVLVLRGHRRILLVTAGWKSTCIPAAKADKMTDAQVLKVWESITGELVADRHENP
jgi:hypothetical protein